MNRRNIAGSLFAALLSHPAFAQDRTCPEKYNDEQAALIKHLAIIGVAGRFCPNLTRDARPLFGNLAVAWNGFQLAEMNCPIWKSTYGEAEAQAKMKITTDDFKSFCEMAVRMYGPSGSIVKGGLIFNGGTP